MTEEQLTGRALDEACAVAMGWHDFLSLSSGTRAGLPPHATHVDAVDVVPAYSTDPALIPEMWDWVKQFGFVEMTSGVAPPGRLVYVECTEVTGWMTQRLKGEAYGSIIPEALARLVVAVAKERSK